MSEDRVILSKERFELSLMRLCHELIEYHGDFSESCIIGIQARGVLLADKIVSILRNDLGIANIEYGQLDITFFRDDFRTRSKPIKAEKTDIDFILDKKKVVLIDDVLYTGRTVQAALSAIQQFGRPESVELLVLIDRRFNRHLPIKADYRGHIVDALDDAYVNVIWDENGDSKIVEIKSSETV